MNGRDADVPKLHNKFAMQRIIRGALTSLNLLESPLQRLRKRNLARQASLSGINRGLDCVIIVEGTSWTRRIVPSLKARVHHQLASFKVVDPCCCR